MSRADGRRSQGPSGGTDPTPREPGSSVSGRRPVHLPPRVALVGLPAELGDYLKDWFARHWPEARVALRSGGQRLVADVVVVDREPDRDPPRPTLWLADIDRSQTLIRLGPTLWRTAMPTTPRRLKRALEACLDSRT